MEELDRITWSSSHIAQFMIVPKRKPLTCLPAHQRIKCGAPIHWGRRVGVKGSRLPHGGTWKQRRKGEKWATADSQHMIPTWDARVEQCARGVRAARLREREMRRYHSKRAPGSSREKRKCSDIRRCSWLLNPMDVIKYTGPYNFNRQIMCILNLIWLVFLFNHLLFIISRYPWVLEAQPSLLLCSHKLVSQRSFSLCSHRKLDVPLRTCTVVEDVVPVALRLKSLACRHVVCSSATWTCRLEDRQGCLCKWQDKAWVYVLVWM